MPSARSRWLVPFALLACSVAAPASGQDPKPENPATRPDPKPENPAIKPEPRPGAWIKAHEGFLERAKGGDVDLLFLGDSITAGWKGAGSATWARHYGPRKAANFGIGGDRTQHVLWRIDNGEVDAIKPRVVVLMIGTNNLGNSAEGQVIEGVAAVVGRLRGKLPEAKVLLLGVFPRGVNRDKNQVATAPDPRVAKVNEGIARLDDGRAVKYLDIGAKFLDESGQVPKALMPDFLHLSREGYQIWADAIEPTLWEMLDQK